MTTDSVSTTATADAPVEPPRVWRWGWLVVAAALGVGILWVTGIVPCGALRAQPECWVAMLPGPTEDVDGLIELSGTESFDSEGDLLLTTVLVDNRLTVGEYLEGIVDGNVELIRRDVLYPPGRSVEDAAVENEILMSDSQLVAKMAALTALEIDFDDLPAGAEVVTVVDDGPADADELLQPGDVIVGVDGEQVGDVEEAIAVLGSRAPGDVVDLDVRRDDEDRAVAVELGDNPDDPGQPYVGVLLRDYQALPVDIEIDAGSIGGPSAGLVFTLGIVDLATPEDLTDGRNVAATGTIDSSGAVGEIGGIVQKIIGAVDGDEAAEVFLVPAGNWDEARTATPDGSVTLVRVATVDDAVEALEALADGRQPAEAVDLG